MCCHTRRAFLLKKCLLSTLRVFFSLQCAEKRRKERKENHDFNSEHSHTSAGPSRGPSGARDMHVAGQLLSLTPRIK